MLSDLLRPNAAVDCGRMSSDEELDLQPKPKRQKRFKFKTFEERVADVSARAQRWSLPLLPCNACLPACL